jgi:hypothetical protein
MARKEDKLRPYRVDYFDVSEMKDNDKALVRSVVIRAVTATVASELVTHGVEGRIIIRSYRFYKHLRHKRDVYKPVEELFSINKALEVMEEVEAYRAAKADPSALTAEEQAALDFLRSDLGHVTRFSDSSLYDEVCTKCGATDASGKLNDPCPVPVVADHATPDPAFGVDKATFYKTNAGTQIQPPTSGPDSPATVAVVADMNSMLSHDAHEQTMDTFVPDNVPEGKRFSVQCPVCHKSVETLFNNVQFPKQEFPDQQFSPRCQECAATWIEEKFKLAQEPFDAFEAYNNVFPPPEPLIEPDKAVGSAGRPAYMNDSQPGIGGTDISPLVEETPLWAKLCIFGGALVFIVGIIRYIFLHH